MTDSLSGITIIATYLYDDGTEYGFHCGKCGYDVGKLKLKFKVEKCPQCDIKSSMAADTLSDGVKAFEEWCVKKSLDDEHVHLAWNAALKAALTFRGEISITGNATLGYFDFLSESADFKTQDIDVGAHHAKIQVHGNDAPQIAKQIVAVLNEPKRESVTQPSKLTQKYELLFSECPKCGNRLIRNSQGIECGELHCDYKADSISQPILGVKK